MTKAPTFTVVIPAYNYAQVLPRAVQSVLSQQDADYELLVINDGSTDDTDSVVKDLLHASGEGFRYINQENAGLAAVRNRGIREGRGTWLIFLDADDEMMPDALSAYDRAATQHPRARLIIGGRESVAVNGDIRRLRPSFVSENPVENFRRYLDKRLAISNGACAMHRDVFATTAYRDTLRHTEDLPVFAHVLANYPAVATQAFVARIYKHATSMRHDVDAAVAVGMELESAIFDDNGLPDGCRDFRHEFRFIRAIALFKLCYAAKQYRRARHFWSVAFGVRPVAALSPRYLRRLIMMMVKGS